MNRNLVGSNQWKVLYSRNCKRQMKSLATIHSKKENHIKILYIVQICQILEFWPLLDNIQRQYVSDWLISKKSSLKTLGQMNQNLVGSILGRSSMKIVHLVPIH
jgi:hypothetical protein